MKNAKQRFCFAPAAHAARRASRSRKLLGQSSFRTAAGNSSRQAAGEEDSAVTEAFSTCQRSFAELEAASGSSDEKLFRTLAAVLKFYHAGAVSEEAQIAYARVIKQTGIKITRNTKNPLLPALKAVFGLTNKSSQGRYAAVLFEAHAERIEPETFAQFVKEKNGLVECAKEGAKRLNPSAAADKDKREKEAMAVLRKTGMSLKSSRLTIALPDGLSVVLIEKEKDGTLTLLAYRPEERCVASRFKSLNIRRMNKCSAKSQ